MTHVKVSPKYQIVIPKEIRDSFPIRRGQKLAVMTKGEMILLIPDLPLKYLRGFAKGVSSEGIREKKDRLI